MIKINFTRTLSDVPNDFDGLIGGNYADDNFNIIVFIKPNAIKYLNFKVVFRKYPKIFPFWAILTIKIHDQENDIFFKIEKEEKRFKQEFTTPFKKDSILKEKTIIIYNITQIPTYICTLTNLGQTCYLNSSIQLIFHLAKFRSLLFSLRNLEPSGILFNLKELFAKMCFNKSEISPEALTDSFGWPLLARYIKHDAVNFIQKLLENIYQKLDDQNQRKFDAIFTSQVIPKNFQSKNNIKSQYIMYISNNSVDSSLTERIEIEMEDTQFYQLSEVLFFSFSSLSYDTIPPHLDMSNFVYKDGPNKFTKYTLSGIIFLNIDKRHYKCFVRNNSKDIWLYFNDSFQTNFSWSYSESFGISKSPLDYSIKEMLDNEEIQINCLMYVADDVIDDYFCFTSNVRNPFQINFNFTPSYDKMRKIMISDLNDIKKYIDEGHTDFENVGCSLDFVISDDSSMSSVYKRVSDEFKVPINSFILRFEDSTTHAPYFHIFSNNDNKKLSCFECFSLHLYFEEITENNEFNYQSIPCYFLLFKFNPISFIHNLNNNLIHEKSSGYNLVSSTPVRKKLPLLPHRTTSNHLSKPLKSNSNKMKRKNCFQFLKCLVLDIYNKFENIIPQLTKEINKLEDENEEKKLQIHLYTAEYKLNEKVKIGYREINVHDTIKETIPQIANGIFIYVQCFDDFSDKSTKLTSNSIKSKFLFYNYIQKAFNKHFYPREIPNVFMLENFSVPVTFCKLTDPLKKFKTMLFPLRLPFLNNLTKLKRIICSIMNEEYPENGLIQLFFGFKEGYSPLNEPLREDKSFDLIIRTLELSMRQTSVKINKFNYTLKSSSSSSTDSDENIDEYNEEEEEEEIDSDFDYTPNIFIHYHIFESFDKNEHISIRVYFSDDSISIKCTSQVLVNKKAKVADIAFNLLNIFPQDKLNENDINDLNRIQNNELAFTDVYRIVQTSNGKIFDELNLNSQLKNIKEIRFERIRNDYNKDDLLGFIPVSYGAFYNNTQYIGSFGTPFYFPVLKSDLNDQQLTNSNDFKNSNLYRRLKRMICEKEIKFKLFVVNFFGFIQNTKFNEIQKIIDKKLRFSICLKGLNASAFIDENAFFYNEIRILK